MRQVFPSASLPVVVVLVAMAGCSDTYHALSTVGRVPELASLREAGAAIPQRTVRVDVAPAGRPPLRLALHETGRGDRGRVVVLVHGLLSDSEVWRFVRPRLAGEYDLIAVDLPGCGLSDAPRPKQRGPDCYAPAAMARSVLSALRQRLADRPAEDRVTLVGHSLGGMLILRMTGDPSIREEFADVLGRVDGLVLMTPVDVCIEKDQPVFRELATLGPTMVALGDFTGLLRERVAASTRDGVGEGCVAVREEADRTIAVLRDPMRRRAMQSIIRQAVPFRGRRPAWDEIDKVVAYYPGVDVPCLILWGARDELFPVSMGYKVAAQVPDARLRVVPRAMHSLPTERPTLCAAAVANFVDRGYPAAAPRFAELGADELLPRAPSRYVAAAAPGEATAGAAPPAGRPSVPPGRALLARQVGSVVELLLTQHPGPVSLEAIQSLLRFPGAAE